MPNTGPDCAEFGGATSCYHIELPDRHLILDAGTGIVALGAELRKRGERKPIDLFLTHFHYDHIIGLPFFAPLFEEGWPVRIFASDLFGPSGLDHALDRLLSAPLCPITRDMLTADVSLCAIGERATEDLGEDARISTVPVSHPGGNGAFRVDHARGSVVYSGDFEHGDADSDRGLTTLMEGADLVLLDCTYTPDTYPASVGYGHAHWKVAGHMAKAAGVKSWLGIHHEHGLDDAALIATEAQVKSTFSNASLAREGSVITV